MLNKSNSCATLLILIEQLAATEELAKQKRMSRSLETKINIASSEADSLEAELAAREAKSTLEQAFSALQQESVLLRLSILNAAIQAIKEKLHERYIASKVPLQSDTSTTHISTSIYANFYKQLLAAETETKIAAQNEFLRKLAVLQSEIAKVECVYQAILIPPNDLQKQHDQIYNLISSLLSINAGNIKQQLSCDLINLDKNINLLLSEPITLCAAASASYTLDENEHSIIQLYDDARAERNSQILHKLDTTITRYKEFQKLYSYLSEDERKLQKHANDLQVLIIDNVAGNLSTITEDSILQFIDNLTDEIASKLVIDLKTLLGASTDTASLAAAQEAVVISIKQTNDKELQKTKDCFNQNLHNIYLKINQCSNDVQFKYDKIKRNLNYAIETSQMEQTSHNLVMVAKKHLHDLM